MSAPWIAMIDDAVIQEWFCSQVLPLERALNGFIRHNWRNPEDLSDIRHDVYEAAIGSARSGLPDNTRAYLMAVARNQLRNRAKRARIVLFDLVADLDALEPEVDLWATERQLSARDELRRFQAGLEQLSPRVREVVVMRKVHELDAKETALRLGIGVDAVNKYVSTGMKMLAEFVLGCGEATTQDSKPELLRRRKR